MPTRARHLLVSCATCIYYMLTYPISPRTSPNNILSQTSTSSNWSFHSAFPHQNPVFSSILCVPHDRPISISLLLSNNMICWRVKNMALLITWLSPNSCYFLSHTSSVSYWGAGKSSARPISRCILFDGENISFDASLVVYINSTNIPPIMIINWTYESQNLLSL